MQGDLAVQRIETAIKASPVWHNSRSAIVILWDENDYSTLTTNQVVFIVETNYGPRGGSRSSKFYDHYSLTKTLDAAFGLPCLNHACDAGVEVMSDLFQEYAARSRTVAHGGRVSSLQCDLSSFQAPPKCAESFFCARSHWLMRSPEPMLRHSTRAAPAAAPCGTGTPPPGHALPEVRPPSGGITLTVRQDGNRLCYVANGNADAPVIRARLGSELTVTLVNEITDPAAIDGVSGPGKLTIAEPACAEFRRLLSESSRG